MTERFKKDIEAFGSPYMKDSFVKKTFLPYEYEKEKVPVGRTFEGNVFHLDLEHPIRCIIVGTPGSGKTFLIRTIMDRLTKIPRGLKKIGYSIFIPTDIKDEFKTSKRQVQKKFRHMNLKGEKPCGQNVITLRPTFFKLVNKRLPKDNHWVSVDMSKMEEYDFMTLLNVNKMTDPQKTLVQDLYGRIKKEPNFNMEKLKDLVKNMVEFDERQINAMKNKLKPLFESEFGDSRYFRDIVKGINQGNIIALNMEDYDLFGKGSFLYPEVFVGMTLRNILIARRRGLVPPLFILVDEAGRFIPKDRNPSCKRDIMESDKRDRKYGVSYIYATQYFSDLPDEVKKTARYTFLPYNIDKKVLAETLKFTAMVHRGYWQNAENDAIQLIQKMKRRQWLVLDRDLKEKHIIDLIAPLSEHSETLN